MTVRGIHVAFRRKRGGENEIGDMVMSRKGNQVSCRSLIGLSHTGEAS